MDILNKIFGLNAAQFGVFILVACRLSGFFLDAPVFSNRNIPVFTKIGLLIFLSVIIFSLLPAQGLKPYTNYSIFFMDMAKEIFIGMVFGFVARLIFAGIQIGGQLIDFQMGFGFVNIIDPESRLQVPIIGQFLFIFATLIFLLINGHHWLIQSLVKSFQIVPPAGLEFNPALTGEINRLFSGIFVIGFKIAAPILVSLFLVDLAYGVIGRAVPQANILVVGFPLKISLGLAFLIFSLPMFFVVIKRFFTQALLNLDLLFKLM